MDEKEGRDAPQNEDAAGAAGKADTSTPSAAAAADAPVEATPKEVTAVDAAKDVAPADGEKDAAPAEAAPPEKPPPPKPKPAAKSANLDPPPTTRGTIAGVIALVILLGGILMSVFIMRRNDAARQQQSQAQARRKGGERRKEPPWQVGQKVPVTITVLGEDAENLECASPTELNGKHCAYENKDTPWSKGGADAAKDDKLLLRPYSTTARQKLIAAGLWSQLEQPLPTKRFSVKCTFEIEGKLDKPGVRFAKGKEFHEVRDAWFAGSVTSCAMVHPGAKDAKSAKPAASAAPSGSAAP